MDTRNRMKGSFFPDQGQDAGHSLRDGKQQKNLVTYWREYFLLLLLLLLPLLILYWPFSRSFFSPLFLKLPLLTCFSGVVLAPWPDLLLLHSVWPKCPVVSSSFAVVVVDIESIENGFYNDDPHPRVESDERKKREKRKEKNAARKKESKRKRPRSFHSFHGHLAIPVWLR